MMMFRFWKCLAVAVGLAAPLRADLLSAGETMCIEFTVSTNLTSVPDMMVLNLGVAGINAPLTSRTAALYDGQSLLGIDVNTNLGTATGLTALIPSNEWASPASVWSAGSPAIIDFTSIQNGSIVGRIEFSVETGQVEILASQVKVRLGQGTGPGTFNSVTPDPVVTSVVVTSAGCAGSSPGIAYCFGDGLGTSCPCGNAGASDEGCANSSGNGATLTANGSSSVLLDDISFQMANGPGPVPAIVFTGTQQVNGGSGSLFGDGLLCAGGTIQRLSVRILDNTGSATWGPGLAPSGGWAAGNIRYFQAWYRDVSGPCNLQFNTSHAVEVTFLP